MQVRDELSRETVEDCGGVKIPYIDWKAKTETVKYDELKKSSYNLFDRELMITVYLSMEKQ